MINEKYRLSLLSIEPNKTIYFKETTLLFLIKGDLMVQFENQEHILMDGDILVFNSNESLKVTKLFREKYALFQIQIDSLFFSSLYPRFFSTKFECFPKQVEKGKREAIYNLRQHLAELLLSHYGAETTKELRVSMCLHQIILLLIQFFQKESGYYNYHLYNDKIIEVIAYIGKNYQHPLALEQVASKFYMSPSALSKLFKAETGYYFSNYLNNLRVSQSLKDLLYTRSNIEEVALNNGFSNSKTYRIQFKKFFNESPSNYRRIFFESELATQTRRTHNDSLLEGDNDDILASLYYYAHMPKNESKDIELVETHKKLSIRTQDVRHQINADIIIHISTLEDLLNADIQEEILIAKNKTGVQYIGIQNLFDESPESYVVYKQENLSIFSPFGKFDRSIKFLEENNLGVYYQLSLSDFETISQFYKIDRQCFLQHLEKKKGSEFLKKWKVNCLFNPHDIMKNIEIFGEIYETLNRINPIIQIGAELPLSYPDYQFETSELQNAYLQNVVAKCDFLSFKSEPNITYEKVDSVMPNLENFYEFVYKETKKIRQRLSEWHIELPLYLSEWNTLTGKSRVTNGTFFRGAIVLRETLKLDLLVSGYGFWLNTDLFEKEQKIKPIKYDGLELFHNHYGKRPIFHVLEIAHRLKGKVVALGEEFMLTQYYDSYQLLLWNANYFAPHLSLKENFLESQSMTFRIEIPEVKDNFYQVKQIELNRHHGAIFYDYEDFKSNDALDDESHVYLSETSRPKMKVFDLEVRNGFDFYCVLDTNAVLLLELNTIKF